MSHASELEPIQASEHGSIRGVGDTGAEWVGGEGGRKKERAANSSCPRKQHPLQYGRRGKWRKRKGKEWYKKKVAMVLAVVVVTVVVVVSDDG